MSWLLLIILAVALAPTMAGWAAFVASSLNHTMHALNGNGPGKGRPSKIGKAECLVAAQKYKCEWLGVVSDGDVVNEARYCVPVKCCMFFVSRITGWLGTYKG